MFIGLCSSAIRGLFLLSIPNQFFASLQKKVKIFSLLFDEVGSFINVVFDPGNYLVKEFGAKVFRVAATKVEASDNRGSTFTIKLQ